MPGNKPSPPTERVRSWEDGTLRLKEHLLSKFCCILYLHLNVVHMCWIMRQDESDLSMRKGRLYAHRGVPQCTGGWVQFLGSDLLPCLTWAMYWGTWPPEVCLSPVDQAITQYSYCIAWNIMQNDGYLSMTVSTLKPAANQDSKNEINLM